MPAIHPQLLAALQEGLFACLCGGLALSALWGAWLLIAPESARRFAAGADCWVPTAGWFNGLNRPLETSRWFYRHHYAAGLLIAAGASYGLWRWFSAYKPGTGQLLLGHRFVSAGLDWLAPALELIFVGFNAAILVCALVVVIRPSLLKTPERYANTWIQVQANEVLDRNFDPLATLLATRPRILGATVAGTCGFLLWRLI